MAGRKYREEERVAMWFMKRKAKSIRFLFIKEKR